VRVGRVVEDDEARVHHLIAARAGLAGTGMAADPTFGFVERDFMVGGKPVGGRHAGDARPDDGDPFA
jgi:hypothetical protein